jgi:glutamyl-tRNA synthetase
MNTHNGGKSTPVRVRFAPSPTGFLHIGNFRAALFNYFFARHNNGSFLLRIEDTDRQRFKQEYVDAIYDSFSWAGLDIDEPAVIQSERIQAHAAVIEKLLKTGDVYRCYCTQQEVVDRHEARYPGDVFVRYDGLCRSIKTVVPEKPYAIRFALPADVHEVEFEDLIRGKITVRIEQLDDFVIVRSDGTPMYNFVVVVDDAFMKITHVIRGEDHIPNTPKQILLGRACGYAIPQFAHLPLILGASGDKLSKRDAAVSIIEYQQQGYLPSALVNYLVRLGWAHGDQEIFSKRELIDLFSLDQVSKKGSIFDIDKLNWINGVYMRQMSSADLIAYTVKHVAPDLLQKYAAWDMQKIERAFDLYKERTHTISELVKQVTDLYAGPATFNQDDMRAWISSATKAHVQMLCARLQALNNPTAEDIQQCVKQVAKELDVKMVALAQPIRIALIGSSNGPGVFDLLSIISLKEAIGRILTLHDAIM